VNCIFCTSNNVSFIKSYPGLFIDEGFKLFGCIDCKCRFFDVTEEIELSALYDEQANDNRNLYQELFRESRYWRREVERIRILAKRSSIHSVLDIGCRTGDFLMHWPSTVEKIGVELSAVSAAIARKRGLTIIDAAVEEHTFSRKFDIVTCYALIEHLRDPIPFVRKLGALVEKDGVLAILIPTWQCLKLRLIESLGLRWHMYSPPLHINFFSREKLDEVMRDCGFEPVARRFTSGGIFNPFGGIPLLNRIAARLMWEVDDHTFINRLPIFDHMYTYYKKR
jgi:SAM-dependent methyltransferase